MGFVIEGELTLFSQVPRYISGAPDLGYHYDALDYTVASMVVKGGTITVQPGTAIGFRNDHIENFWSLGGFQLSGNSTFISKGTPNSPNTFASVLFVQEGPFLFPRTVFWDFYGIDYHMLAFAPNLWELDKAPPKMDFRFSNFYLPTEDYQFWSGFSWELGYGWSPDSSMDWRMQDCNLHGGHITIGYSDFGRGYSITPPGSLFWANNLFDRLNIRLDPNYYAYPGGLNIDFKFAVNNNLFRGGRMVVNSRETSTGELWAFGDNLFDKVAFEYQSDGPPPLNHDYNGYWERTSSELEPWQMSRLAVNNDDGGTDAVNDMVLSSAPAYQTSTFGNYYLPTSSPLHKAGSRSPAEAGLYHYTTRTDQTKEGDETGNVSIGLHYVAASNGFPKDSDSGGGDGIPDYVEDANGNGQFDSNETDPTLAMTDGVTPDAYSTVYDDIDLSGNGLVGRIKRALNLNPLDANNPLTLLQITTGEEPDFATFEIPVSYDRVTNAGTLNLNMNGIDVTLEECTRATNGNCLLSFNVAFDPLGQHYLSAGFRYGSDPGTEHPVTLSMGKLLPFYSSNSVQFFESGSMFDDSGAYVDAKLFAADADYQIDLYDTSTTPPTLIKTITNSTSNGFIEENWDGMLADGVTPFTNSEVQAVFTVAYANTPGNVSTNKPKKILTRAKGSLSEWGPNMDVVYFYTPTNDALKTAYAKNGAIWNGLQGMVDALIKPNLGYGVYQSYFNRYLPDIHGEYPGYMTRRSRLTNDPASLPSVIETLLPDMTNGLTKQIYIRGHGTNSWIGNYDDDAYITASDVSSRLKNTYTKTNGLMTQNPYRFVWLDGCATASGKDWRRAFGIYPIGKGAQEQAARNKTGAQAYVGWADIHAGWLGFSENSTAAINIAKGYTQTLANFYSMWMNGRPLKECLDVASVSASGRTPLAVPENKNVTVFGTGYSYSYTNISTSKIYIVGFQGLTVNGVNTGVTPAKKYIAPSNVE